MSSSTCKCSKSSLFSSFNPKKPICICQHQRWWWGLLVAGDGSKIVDGFSILTITDDMDPIMQQLSNTVPIWWSLWNSINSRTRLLRICLSHFYFILFHFYIFSFRKLFLREYKTNNVISLLKFYDLKIWYWANISKALKLSQYDLLWYKWNHLLFLT